MNHTIDGPLADDDYLKVFPFFSRAEAKGGNNPALPVNHLADESS